MREETKMDNLKMFLKKVFKFTKKYWREILIVIAFFYLNMGIQQAVDNSKRAYNNAADAADYAADATYYAANAADYAADAYDSARYCEYLY